MSRCGLLLLACAVGSSWAQEPDQRLHADGQGWRLDKAKVTDPKRPRVLLVGDSILNGYQAAVTKALAGRAHVDAWVNPYHQATGRLAEMIAEVLANGPYDLVHLNMGLHGWPAGRIPAGQFEPLTRKLVEAYRAGAPKATLIWASSTPVTAKGEPGKLDEAINSIIVEHNRLAAKVMAELKVPVNDLYGVLVSRLELARGDQFHWRPEGYELLAKAIVAELGRRLPGEPTNAAELAAKRAAEDKAVDERFRQWVATLPADQRRWEETLTACLGGFYLPLYQRDRLAGRATAWDWVQDDPKLPRVLLIGDSISRGYTLPVRRELAGKANVHRAPENCGPTSNGVKKLDIWLGEGKWDVIHFNFGIHDRATPPADYEQRLQTIVARLKATGAKLIWASSTPLPAQSQYGADAVIVARNQLAAKVMAEHQIPINDLYGHVLPELAKYQNPNDVHFGGPGYDFLGAQVAKVIAATLAR